MGHRKALQNSTAFFLSLMLHLMNPALVVLWTLGEVFHLCVCIGRLDVHNAFTQPSITWLIPTLLLKPNLTASSSLETLLTHSELGPTFLYSWRLLCYSLYAVH